MLGTLRLIFGLGLSEGVRDGLGVIDLLRPNDGLDGIERVDLGLIDGLDRLWVMEGLVLPGLMDGLGRLGVMERFEFDPADPRLLLTRSSREPRLELLDDGADCPMIDGRRLGIEKPLRYCGVGVRLLLVLGLDVDRLGVRIVAPEFDRDLNRLNASEREVLLPSTDEAINRATPTTTATAAARESFLSPMTNILTLLSPAVMLSASPAPHPAHRRYRGTRTRSCRMTIPLSKKSSPI